MPFAIRFIWKIERDRNISGDLRLLFCVFRMFFQSRSVQYQNLDMSIGFPKQLLHGMTLMKSFLSQVIN